MTVVPLPASPCVRVRLLYTQNDSFDMGSRFYLSYSGSAPTPGNCTTLAGDVAAAWNTDIAPLINGNDSLTEVDVLDITTDAGASGQWTGTHAGTRSGTNLPAQTAVNIEFDIARRYRGGKPRMFLPPPVTSDLADPGHYDNTYITAVNTGFAAFITAITGASIGSMGTLAHVNLSYYKGFTNITNSSGRERAVPTYRETALLDSVESYACKALLGSQRRRRNATTP